MRSCNIYKKRSTRPKSNQITNSNKRIFLPTYILNLIREKSKSDDSGKKFCHEYETMQLACNMKSSSNLSITQLLPTNAPYKTTLLLPIKINYSIRVLTTDIDETDAILKESCKQK